jgi:hypothetical protein
MFMKSSIVDGVCWYERLDKMYWDPKKEITLEEESIFFNMLRVASLCRVKCTPVHFRVLNGTNRYLSDTTNTNHKVNALLKDWPGNHRLGVNRLMRFIQIDDDVLIKAEKSDIDQRSWYDYCNYYRRLLMKEPMQAVNNDTTLFLKLVKLIEPLQVKINIASTSSVAVAASSSSSDPDNNNLKRYSSDDNELIANNPQIKNAIDLIIPIMIKGAQIEYSQSIAAKKTLLVSSDMRSPASLYPAARLIKRKIIYHGGPTNSGKTYEAIQRLKSARNGIYGGGLYCGPLRLLALEVYENLNRDGIYTDLLTGQEKRFVPFSTHVSSTLEMVNLNKEYDVAVIDEIQMISDTQRGYAWTRALLGLQAKEIHICGGIEALNVVKMLLEDTGDEFELKEYNRLGELVVSNESLKGDYRKVRPGDCIVAFSRADIFSIKRQIEKYTKYKCSTIYGALPPETRSEQARMFNEEKLDILVASDAIGMGLNLNIGRIIFHTTIKKGKNSPYLVDPSNIKQIAGRAGRLSSKYKVGHVTAWQEFDLAYIKAVMQMNVPPLLTAGIFPNLEHIESFSQQLSKVSIDIQPKKLPTIGDDADAADVDTEADTDADADADADADVDVDAVVTESMKVASDKENTSNALEMVYNESEMKLSLLLERFVELSQLDGRYHLCDHADTSIVSNWLHSIPMTLGDRFIFSNAPVSIRDESSMNVLYNFASQYAQNRPIALNVRLNRYSPKDIKDLEILCQKHNHLDLYIWLSLRFPTYFVESEKALEQKLFAVKMIKTSLSINLNQDQVYSHSDSHRKVYRKVLNSTFDGLPDIKYGEELRKNTKDYLSHIPNDELVLYPLIGSEINTGTGGGAGGGGKGGDMSYNANSNRKYGQGQQRRQQQQQQQQHRRHSDKNKTSSSV